MNLCRMKNVVVLIALFTVTMSFSAFAQQTDLEGTWSIEQIDIWEITDNDELISRPYQQGIYDNSSHCIFPVLKFDKDGQCICVDEELNEFPWKYTVEEESELTLWFTAPVTFSFHIEVNNKLYISREYSLYDHTTKESTKMKVNLIYSKK